MQDALLRFRSEFPILQKSTYLISNSLGAMPRGVEDGLMEYTRSWKERGVRAWEEAWWGMAFEVGDSLGELMNAPTGTVAVHTNVAQCQQTIASCFDFSGKRNKIVYDD